MKSLLLPWLFTVILGFVSFSASAVTVESTETKDGASRIVTEVVEKTTPTGKYLISAFAMFVGSLISWWGIKLAKSNLPTTSHHATANIEVDLGKKKLKFSKLIPPLFIVAIGGIIVIAGIVLAAGEHVLTATI